VVYLKNEIETLKERRMSDEIKTEGLTEEELKEVRRRKRALKKKRLAQKKARDEQRLRALLEDDEVEQLVETPEERTARLYEKAKKKMTFAPNMFHREDQADMYRQAAELFAKTAGYEQSDELGEECRQQAQSHRELYLAETYEWCEGQIPAAATLTECRKIEEKLDAIADYRDVAAFRQSLADRKNWVEKKIKRRKALKVCLAVVVLLVIAAAVFYVQSNFIEL
jgi:hypothetical protein